MKTSMLKPMVLHTGSDTAQMTCEIGHKWHSSGANTLTLL